MPTEKQRDDQIGNLYNDVDTVSEIKCSKCGIMDSAQLDSYDAAEEFYEEGWRSTDKGNVYCEKCAKKYLKSKKYA